MFIYSVRASSLKFAMIVLVGVSVFLALFLLIPPVSNEDSAVSAVSYENVRTNEDRRAFLSSLGYEVSESEVDSVKIRIPSEFDKIYASYNEMQKAHHLSLPGGRSGPQEPGSGPGSFMVGVSDP